MSEPCCCPCSDKESAAFQWNANGDLNLFPVETPAGNPETGAFDAPRFVQKSLRLKSWRVSQRRTTGDANGNVIVNLYSRTGGAYTLLGQISIPQNPATFWASSGQNLSVKVAPGTMLIASFDNDSAPGAINPPGSPNPDLVVQVFAEEA